jgi:hypothetical protein
MQIFFVNTDAKSNRKHSYHDAWFARGIAVTSGQLKKVTDLSRIARNDLVGMYVKKVGLVAVGIPLDDQVVEVRGPGRTVSPTEPFERHRRMDWLVDLRVAPLSIGELKSLDVTINADPVRWVKEPTEKLKVRLQHLLAAPPFSSAWVRSCGRLACRIRRVPRAGTWFSSVTLPSVPGSCTGPKARASTADGLRLS